MTEIRPTFSKSVGGMRGVGEGGAIIGPPTLVNAIADALAPFGEVPVVLPLTPAKLLSIIEGRNLRAAVSIERSTGSVAIRPEVDKPTPQVAVPVEDLIDGEASAVAHVNADHADAIRLYATKLLGADDGAWQLTGVDPDGIDLAQSDATLRLPFLQRVTTAQALRKALVEFAAQARAK